MALTTVSEVRRISNVTSSEVSDSIISNLILEATKELMRKINTKVTRERILYIDNTRENKIDGDNTTYYIKKWYGNYLGDTNLDGTVDTDDITVYAVHDDGTETTATVSSVTYNEGKFVLSSAYSSSYKLFVSYTYTPIDPMTPDALLGLAASYLTSAYAYLKRDAGIDGSVKFGNVTISQKLSAGYGEYMKKYKDIMKEVLGYSTLKSNWREANVQI